MAIKLEDYLASLSDCERLAAVAKGQSLIAEEATLREIRAAHSQSQAMIAEKFGVNQAAVSKLERRTDMYVSTLRDYIRAMGGELEIIARFPGKPPIKISQFRALRD
jgi:DNA-binding XRE family transcriptional regulator